MRCIYCNAPLAEIDYCPNCGADISIQKRIARISNLLYNDGLEKALIRDLEGAITCLNRSLKFNKENTDARNLLGLCYYETGEIVSALCEWVISKNLQPDDNIADAYIDDLQNNKNRLETINQSIVKYNQSVTYCREDNEDMAIIQLRKVINHNPKFVKAYQLLALLYMKRTEYEKARKTLKKAAQIDVTNTTTLLYLQEIEEATGRSNSLKERHKRYENDREGGTVSGTLRYQSGNEMIIQPTTFRDSSTVATFINIILGILLGGAIVWFMVVPANRQSINDSANKEVTEANSKLVAVQTQADELMGEIDGYADQTKEAESERDAALSKADSYDDLIGMANQYISGDSDAVAAEIVTLNADEFDGNAKMLYETISGAVSETLFAQYYNEGTSYYTQTDYRNAAQSLEMAIEMDPDRQQPNHYNAMLYLGMSYYYLGESSDADRVFNEIIRYYPEFSSVVEGYLSTNGTQQDTAADTIDLSGLGNATTAGAGSSGAARSAAAQSGTDADSGDTAGGTDTDTGTAFYAEGNTDTDEDGITIYDDTDTSSSVVWTDPTTGLNYDANGTVIN